MTGKVSKLYQDRVRLGEIDGDPAQRGVAGRLDELASALAAWRRQRPGFLRALASSRGGLPRGLFIYGGVGRGKTMLMDLFHSSVDFAPKRRLHFHEFMAEVHERIGRGRAATGGDPIPLVAAEIAAEARLLCFDELHVTDIADAMILGRLFKALFDKDVILVATSNVPPRGLYHNGLNRQLFLPFIGMLEERLGLVELKSAKDFRLDKLAGRRLYFTPADDAAHAGIDAHWERLTGHHPSEPVELEIKGRKLRVPMASMGVARFSFAELCERPLGANDYLHIAHAFHTVLIDAIPQLGPERRNEARRLVNLIDTLYDNRVCLIASAGAEPQDLYPAGDGALLFERTASRLIEMRSEAYLSGGRSVEALALAGKV